MEIATNMGLTIWDLETDAYDHDELAENWRLVDRHDHAPGRGAPLSADAFPILGQGNLGPCSVSSYQLCNGAVTTAKIADLAVTTAKLADGSVTRAKLADGAINETTIVDNSITEFKIRLNGVGSWHLKQNCVTSEKINTHAVINDHLTDECVTTGKIRNGHVTGPKIPSGAIGNGHLQTSCVTQPNVATGCINPYQQDVVPTTCVETTSNIPIAPNVEWTVYFQNQVWDSGWDMWDGQGSFVVPFTGLYLFIGGILIQDDGSGGIILKLLMNGTVVATVSGGVVLNGRSRMNASAMLWLEEGDACSTTVYHQHSGPLACYPDSRATAQSLTWISPPPGGYA